MTTLERIESIEKAQAELDAKFNSILNLLGQVQSTQQQVNATEQSVISLGKTLTATLKVLVANAVVSSEDVMTEIVKIDSRADQEELERMKATGHLSPSDVVTDECVVVVSQSFVSARAPEKLKMVSDFVLIRMPLPTLSPQIRADMQGRMIGESIPTSKTPEGEYYMLTVKEIYKLNFESKGGEEKPNCKDACETCIGTCDGNQCDNKS